MRHKRALIFTIVIALLSTLVYFEMTSFAPKRLKVRIDTVESTRIPKSFNNVAIGYISDIYGVTENFDRSITMLKDFNPDIIIFGGNLFEGTPTQEEITHYTEKLSELNPRLGKFYVLGEDDIKKNLDVTHQVLTAAQFRNIANTVAPLHNNHDEFIQLVGLDAANDVNTSTQFTYPDVKEDIYNITVANNPDYVDNFKNVTVDVMVAGKTLGGHVRLPLIGSLTSKSKYIKHRQMVDETTLIVSSGVGLKDPNVRLLSHPDVTIIMLKSPQE